MAFRHVPTLDRRRPRHILRGVLATLGVATALVAPAAIPAVSATSLSYNCTSPAGWTPLHNPANSIDIQVKDQLEQSLAAGPLPVTLTYTGPTKGYEGQTISRKWDLSVSLTVDNASNNVNLSIDPGLGSSAVAATGATPASGTAPIPDMPLQSHNIGPGISAVFAFSTTLTSSAVLTSDPASFTPGSFDLPLWVAVKPFSAYYGVTGSMTCTPVAATQVGTVNVDMKNGGFTGLTPSRVLDTRSTSCVSSAGRTLTVRGVAGVPAVADTVALNVTALGSTSGGFVTVYPSGETRPTASNLNYAKGQTIPNMVVAKVGADGKVVIYSSAGCPNILVDVVGWYEGPTAATGGIEGLTPARILDTRSAVPCVGTGGRNLTVTGVAGVPAGAGSVVLNVTATGSTAGGYVTVWPTGQARPTASNLNYAKGQSIPNLVIAKVGSGGSISIYASAGCPNVLVDVVGWHEGSAALNGGLAGVTPARLLDTRTSACVGAAGKTLKVTSVGGVPANASSVALNVTVVRPSGAGYVTVWPTGQTRPTASNLNYVKDQTIPNMVLAKVGTGGNISIYTSGGCPNVLVDVVGWFAAPQY